MSIAIVTRAVPQVDRRRHLRRTARAVLVAITLFSLLAGYACFRFNDARRFPLSPIDLESAWVQAPGADSYTGYFRLPVDLESTVTSAWIAISACDGFEVTVNQDPVGRHYAWRPTRPFQNGLSEKGQRLTTNRSAMDLNFPREYQWSGHESYRIPVLIDIRPELKRGQNVIAIQIESRRAPAKFALIGGITLATGRHIPLKSGPDWRATTVPPGHGVMDWTHGGYDDHLWQSAATGQAPSGTTVRSFDSQVFACPIEGQLLESPNATAADSVWYRSNWDIAVQPESAWIRLFTTRKFDLFVNDRHVSLKQSFVPDADNGEWILGCDQSQDPRSRPTVLDPDEADSPFVGDDFELPPSGDPTRWGFRSMPVTIHELQSRSRHARTPYADKFGSVRSREDDPSGHPDSLDYPNGVRPPALQRNRHVEHFVAFDLSRVVRQGPNKVEIRLAQSDNSQPLNWRAKLAADGRAQSRNGVENGIRSNAQWETRLGNTGAWCHASAKPLVAANLAAFPRLQYRGKATDTTADATSCCRYQLLLLSIAACLTGCIFLATRYVTPREKRVQVATQVGRLLFGVFLCSSVVLAIGLFVQCAFAERHEALWFQDAGTWAFLLLSAAWFGIVAGFVDLCFRREGHRPKSSASNLSLREPTKTQWWRLAIWAVLALSFFTRAYRLDFQPLDDDEYASTQAILSIAETGVPNFAVDEVWYTRSPLYHYLMGACAAVMGGNLWTMRLPNVLFGVATCWLTYVIGNRLLRRPWVGMGAMLLLAIHPFEVYTGHVIRFYQLQQLLALVTVYCFCRGYVTEQSSRYRELTILAFLATVLCQEASCVMGFSLLLGYLFFAEEKSAKNNLRLVVMALCALVIIGLDYLTFQTRCMTRLAGISPNLEATIKPHFWYPLNFLSVFVGYSRLHVLGSAFLLCGLPFVCRLRNRCTMALYVILFSGVAFTNLLITHVSLRYQYWLIPLWVLLSLEGMRALLSQFAAYGIDRHKEAGRHRRLVAATAGVCFVGCVVVFSPWRMQGSYDQKLVGDSTGAMQFIRANRRQDDLVMVTEPHTHAALLEIGQVDYDLSVPLLYDFAMLKNGQLIDRNGGATVIGDLEHLAATFRTHDRVWIAVNHEKLRSRGKNLRWDYPGARVESFLRQNCELVHKTYLWSVYCWDAQQGVFTPFRSNQL